MPNAYIEFVKKNRAAIAKKHPNASPQEIMSLVAAEYKKKPVSKVKKGRGAKLEDIATGIPVDLNKLVGTTAPDGKSKWYKNDTVSSRAVDDQGFFYEADPGKNLQDNVNNLYYKDGKIWLSKRYMTPLMKSVGMARWYNYKNPGNMGLLRGLVEGATNIDNYKVAAQYYNKYLAPGFNLVVGPVAGLAVKAFTKGLENDLKELFPGQVEEKKAGSGRKIKPIARR